MTQPAPGVSTGVQRDREGRVQHLSLAVTKTGVEYRSIGVSGPCPGCGTRICYGSNSHHIPTHKGPPCVAPGDLVYCPKCKACAVIGDDLGLTPCPDPTEPDAALAHRHRVGRLRSRAPVVSALESSRASETVVFVECSATSARALHSWIDLIRHPQINTTVSVFCTVVRNAWHVFKILQTVV